MCSFEIREITSKIDIQKVVNFQNEIWGHTNTTPYPFLIASCHNGGILIGAFNGQKLVGFCYGFPGFKQKEIYLVSHMMAVSENTRNSGLGYLMKMKQKEWAVQNGYRKMVWTFDPLESRNAYLNIHKLGGYIRNYFPNHYGDMMDDLNGGLPSDRFLLEWDLTQVLNEKITMDENIKSFLLVEEENQPFPIPLPLTKSLSLDEDYYAVPVPSNIHKIKKEDSKLAESWRFILRDCFQELFQQNYIILSFHKTNQSVHYYILKKMEVENAR